MSEARADPAGPGGAGAAGRSPVVELEGVDFAYDGAPVLRDVSFAIPRRDFVGIVGPNGGGKTTLLKLMLGLLQPDRGTVRVFGRPPAEASERVGYVPQNFQYDSRLPVTAADVVLMGYLGHGVGFASQAGAAAVREALAAVDLPGLEPRRFADLSGGQQQRVLIARALATQPDILMLDEPTASLDAAAEREVLDLLGELNGRMTVVLVTHDLDFVSSAVKSVLCANRQVRRHPTTEVGETAGELLGRIRDSDLRVVRHDHDCQEGAHGE